MEQKEQISEKTAREIISINNNYSNTDQTIQEWYSEWAKIANTAIAELEQRIKELEAGK